MLNGKDVWNMWFQKEMGDLTVGDRTVYTFPKMKKSFYEMLKDTAERFSEKTGLCDNWGAVTVIGNFFTWWIPWRHI